MSLQRRLTIILLGLTLLTWFVSVAVTTYHAGKIMVRQTDEHLRQYSDMAQHSLYGIMSDPVVRSYFRAKSVTLSAEERVRRVETFRTDNTGNAANLWFGRNQILLGASAPRFPAPEKEGFVTRQMDDGSVWRILYSQSPEYRVWYATGVDLQTARQGSLAAFALAVLPLLFILPITLVILYYGIRRGLRPLNRLAEQIAMRKPQALHPFELSGVPAEATPIVRSLNSLVGRLQRALVNEQRFTANAAHELQTPLAAVQVTVQTCLRQLQGASDYADVRLMLARVSGRISGASDMVKQLLTLARLDPDQEIERRQVDLEELVGDVIADVGSLAVERRISLRFEDMLPARVEGHPEWLKILLRNLFSNAFKYATAGSEIDVIMEDLPEEIRLVIANDCEPIPAEDFQRLTERFYHRSSSEEGAGLGLSIVQRIASLHRASLQFSSRQDGRGFVAEIRFPKSAIEP